MTLFWFQIPSLGTAGTGCILRAAGQSSELKPETAPGLPLPSPAGLLSHCHRDRLLVCGLLNGTPELMAFLRNKNDLPVCNLLVLRHLQSTDDGVLVTASSFH